MSLRNHKAAHAGFTLVEVMVALLVISIGLLGIAKMQALALASTGTARMRSIAALEAASMAAMMHANRGYWSSFQSPASPSAPLVVTATVAASNSNSFTSTDGSVALPSGNVCTAGSSTCSEPQIAAVDLISWATALSQTMPSNATGTITCDGSTALTPVACTVRIDWVENLVQLNTTTNTALTASQTASALQTGAGASGSSGAAAHFILNVEP